MPDQMYTGTWSPEGNHASLPPVQGKESHEVQAILVC